MRKIFDCERLAEIALEEMNGPLNGAKCKVNIEFFRHMQKL